MTYQQILGLRIKNFRKRAKLSQFALEELIDASPGYLSRLESGEINPTKETINQIGKVLKLNEREMSYLIGKIFYPATDEELNEARMEVKDFFRKKGVLAYMLDDRKRLVDISDTFVKVLNFTVKDKETYLLMPFVSLIYDPKLNIQSKVSKNNYEEFTRSYLSKFYLDTSFMVDDQIYLKALESIRKHPDANKIWQNILYNPPKLLQTIENRTIVFSIKGKDVPLTYSIQPLLSHRRFEIIEYHPTNLFHKIASKFL